MLAAEMEEQDVEIDGITLGDMALRRIYQNDVADVSLKRKWACCGSTNPLRAGIPTS